MTGWTALPKRRALIALCVVTTLAAPGRAQTPGVDTLALRAHTYFLSHDLLRGRATGTPGADLAAAYIASACRAHGLTSLHGDYFQPVPLEAAEVLPSTRLVVSAHGDTIQFAHPRDVVFNMGTRATLVNFAGPAAYVGTADELAAGIPDTPDVRGKVAVTFGPVDVATAQALATRGAVGMIHLIGDPDAYQLYARSRGTWRLYHRDPDVRSSFLPVLPSLLGGPRLAMALLAGTSVLVDEQPVAQDLDRSVVLRIALRRRLVDAVNVVCLAPGADPAARDTVIFFTAHYDHLGVGVPDASGDSVYNGFSDNAAGVAMLLAIAQQLVRAAPPTRHSVLFLFSTGEERGLLGSDYYVAHPLWPLERTAAVINLDAGAPAAAPVSWRLAGVDTTDLVRAAMVVADRRRWQITTSPPRPNSDYYPFAREGVPAVFVIPGALPYEGLGPDSSRALKERWDRYHQPGDEWHEDFPFAGLARYAAFAYEIARAIDGAPAPATGGER